MVSASVTIAEGYSRSELEAWADYQRSFGDVVPEIDVRNKFWSYGEQELVGHGKQTNDKCGTFNRFMGCLNVEAHNASRWFNPDLKKDSVFVKSVYHSCDKPTCPKCFKFGWSVREAFRVETRLKEASKFYGEVEHIICSVPESDYGLGLEDLRHKAVKILANRGVIGGSMCFHGFRYSNRKESIRKSVPFGWRWSPHIHVLGFVGGEGYEICRRCKGADCYACSGFEGLTRREHEKDKWIVKVMEKRKTIGGTAWYELNHCSIRRGSKKSHAVSWFGVVGYRKLKLINVKDVGVKHKCPICGSDLVRVRYLGAFSEVSVSRRGEAMSMLGDDGEPLWEVVVERKFKGG
jgi:hypothetical protein